MREEELRFDEAFRRKTIRSFMPDGYIETMPAQFKKRFVLYLEILRAFEPGRDYPEREVNAVIGRVYEDFCTTRRDFVELGLMSRNRAGIYRKNTLPVADAHCDTLYAIGVDGKAPDACVVRAQRMAAGGVGLQTFAMFAGEKGPAGHPYDMGKKMLAATDRVGVPFLKGDLPEDMPVTPTGILSIEGGEMLEGRLDRLHEFDDACRVRMIALTWNNENEIAHPAKAGETGGLKPFGLELLEEMDALGVLADVSHLNVEGFWDVIGHARLPVIASHSNLRTLCDVPRDLYKEQVRAIIEKKGFIGINFYSRFLRAEGDATLDDVLRHIDGIAELGGIDVLGFGSDFDGIDKWPEGLADPTDFQNLLELLWRHGYTESQLRGIAGQNLWRVLKTAQQARA